MKSKRGRLFVKIILSFLILSIFVSLASIISSNASAIYTRPRKSVFLVIDDSGSMMGRSELDANYALQTFLATMDKDDEVSIYFLNNKNAIGSADIAKKDNKLLESVRKKACLQIARNP